MGSSASGNAGILCSVIILLLAITWLAVSAVVLTACRAAARGDAPRETARSGRSLKPGSAR
jgi:uncharacterized iron-regulated membrane protein